jgi:hypothetical protein
MACLPAPVEEISDDHGTAQHQGIEHNAGPNKNRSDHDHIENPDDGTTKLIILPCPPLERWDK